MIQIDEVMLVNYKYVYEKKSISHKMSKPVYVQDEMNFLIPIFILFIKNQHEHQEILVNGNVLLINKKKKDML